MTSLPTFLSIYTYSSAWHKNQVSHSGPLQWTKQVPGGSWLLLNQWIHAGTVVMKRKWKCYWAFHRIILKNKMFSYNVCSIVKVWTVVCCLSPNSIESFLKVCNLTVMISQEYYKRMKYFVKINWKNHEHLILYSALWSTWSNPL